MGEGGEREKGWGANNPTFTAEEMRYLSETHEKKPKERCANTYRLKVKNIC